MVIRTIRTIATGIPHLGIAQDGFRGTGGVITIIIQIMDIIRIMDITEEDIMVGINITEDVVAAVTRRDISWQKEVGDYVREDQDGQKHRSRTPVRPGHTLTLSLR